MVAIVKDFGFRGSWRPRRLFAIDIGVDFSGVGASVALRDIVRQFHIGVTFGGNRYPNVDFNGLNPATNPFANLLAPRGPTRGAPLPRRRR